MSENDKLGLGGWSVIIILAIGLTCVVYYGFPQFVEHGFDAALKEPDRC